MWSDWTHLDNPRWPPHFKVINLNSHLPNHLCQVRYHTHKFQGLNMGIFEGSLFWLCIYCVEQTEIPGWSLTLTLYWSNPRCWASVKCSLCVFSFVLWDNPGW
jgi:hypothetical protein